VPLFETRELNNYNNNIKILTEGTKLAALSRGM
jgi:hypothetical protein